jgi:hypothetical protein
MQLFRKQAGVKGSATINIFDQDVVLQPGGCGFNASGSTPLTQRTISTAFLKVDKSYCPDDLRGFYLQAELTPGSIETTIPWEETFAEKQADVIATTIETLIWQGNKASTAANLSYINGFNQVVSASGAQPVTSNGYVTGSFHASSSAGFATALSGSAIQNVITGVVTSIPAQVLDQDDVAIFVGRDVALLYQAYLVSANLYHYTADADNTGVTHIPGYNLRMIPLNGLNGTGYIYAGRQSNFVIGVDMEDDAAKFKMWWDESTQVIKFTCKFTLGVQVAFPNELVVWYNGQ